MPDLNVLKSGLYMYILSISIAVLSLVFLTEGLVIRPFSLF